MSSHKTGLEQETNEESIVGLKLILAKLASQYSDAATFVRFHFESQQHLSDEFDGYERVMGCSKWSDVLYRIMTIQHYRNIRHGTEIARDLIRGPKTNEPGACPLPIHLSGPQNC